MFAQDSSALEKIAVIITARVGRAGGRSVGDPAVLALDSRVAWPRFSVSVIL